MTDPIADMLTRIRNASAVRKNEVVLPMSKVKFEIAKILEKTNWIEKAESIKAEKSGFDELKIVLKYKKSGNSAITKLQRISKPGLRVYVDKDNIPKVLNGLGICIISTSRGLMTGAEAKRAQIGGELICKIY